MIYLDSKEKIRKKLIKKRNSLSTYEVLKKSNEIILNLKKLKEFKKARRIACYISFGNEVYTHGLIKEFLNKKEILVPFVDREKKELKLSYIKDWKELHQGAYGILEPKKEFLKIRNDVDLILVPGIAFDERGHRIGYGEGYFDRLLSKIDAVKIGLAYEFQILKEIPYEEHDEKVDIIVSEKKIRKINI